MIVTQEKNIKIITQERLDNPSLVSEITSQYDDFKNENIVLVLNTFDEDMDKNEILEFLPLSNTHRANNKSFVVVIEAFDFDSFEDEELILVPTLQEAFDMIEMEEIERDLGF